MVSIDARFDTVGIAFPVRDFDRVGCEVRVSNYGQIGESFKYSRKLPGGGFLATGAGGKAWVEASLPKRVSEDNTEALSVTDGLEVLEGLYEEALSYVDTKDYETFDECQIVRLDLVRDFKECGQIGSLLDGLAGVEQPGRVKVRRFADPSRGAAETLRVGPKAWGCTLYDKYRESKGAAPEGSLRFETRLHSDQLCSSWAKSNGGHFGQVADLVREESLSVAQRGWFGRAGFDRAILAPSRLQTGLLSLGLPAREIAGLYAYLTLDGFANELSYNTRLKYRRMTSDLGLTPSNGTEVPRSLVLDYELGTMRYAA